MPYRSALFIGARQAFQFLLITINYRMVAAGSYGGTAASDAAICWFGWMLLKRNVEATHWIERLGYTLGGAAGSILGLYLTK